MLGGSALEYAQRRVGIVETVAICMCPELPDNLAERDPLGVLTNGYPEMPMDATAFKGEPPRSEKIRLTYHLAAEAHRKMYTFNTAYASIAYLSSPKHYVWATEAMKDPEIQQSVLDALAESTIGLCGEYGFTREEMAAWNERILAVIDNPLLGDTINRLGSDTPRKVGPAGPPGRRGPAVPQARRGPGDPGPRHRLCLPLPGLRRPPAPPPSCALSSPRGSRPRWSAIPAWRCATSSHRRIREIYEKLEDPA